MNTNVNCFTLMNTACKKLKGNFGKAFLATLVVIAPLVAISFIPYYIGIVLALFFSGYLFYGLIEYYKKLFKGENPSLKVVFTNYSKFGAATLMGIINIICMVIGFILLIFPSIVYMIYYCVNMHILSDQKETNILGAFNENSTRMIGNKTLVLSYKILLYFLMALIIAACGLLFVPISTLYASNFALSIFLGILVVIVGIILLALVNVLYQATQMEFYLNCLPSKKFADNYIRENNQKVIEKRKAKANSKNGSNETCPNCEKEQTTTKTTEETKDVIPEENKVEKVVEEKKENTKNNKKSK